MSDFEFSNSTKVLKAIIPENDIKRKKLASVIVVG
jgi:hypothetical protein